MRAHTRKKRRGRPQGSFTQHRRMDRLKSLLESSPGGLELADLAASLQVTTRSIRRYLDALNATTPIESVPKTPGGAHVWRIKPTERGRAVHLRRTQAYALLAARAAFEPMRGSALYDELDVAHRQIMQIAQRPARAGVKGEIPSDQRLEERFVYLAHPPRFSRRGEDIDKLFLAVAELHPIRFRSAGTQIHAHPYAMVLYRGAIVVVARELDAHEIRCFPLEQMTDIAPDETRRFALPADFDVGAYLHGAFGVGRAGPRTRVLIEFDARVAPEVKQTKLHPSQKIATAPDGRVRLSLTLSDVSELKRWILGFGEAARVIEPDDLAVEVATSLRRAASRYD